MFIILKIISYFRTDDAAPGGERRKREIMELAQTVMNGITKFD